MCFFLYLNTFKIKRRLKILYTLNLGESGTYDYVFRGPLDIQSQPLSSTLKLTSPPIRLRPDGNFLLGLLKYKILFKADNFLDTNHRKNHVDDSNGSRRSFSKAFKRPRYLVDSGPRHRQEKDRFRERFNVDDEATLRQLLLE